MKDARDISEEPKLSTEYRLRYMPVVDEIVGRVTAQTRAIIPSEQRDQIVDQVDEIIRRELISGIRGLERRESALGKLCLVSITFILIGASTYCAVHGQQTFAGMVLAFGIFGFIGVFNQWHWFE